MSRRIIPKLESTDLRGEVDVAILTMRGAGGRRIETISNGSLLRGGGVQHLVPTCRRRLFHRSHHTEPATRDE